MILVIDNYDSFTYNLVQYIGQMAPVEVVRNDALGIPEILAKNPAGIVISPGPGRPEDAGISVELIQAAGSRIPILGVCLGHQAIALAYGGRIIAAPRPMHGKADAITHRGRGLFKNLPSPFMAGRYHSLAVEVEKVAVLRVEAESGDGTVMAITHQTYPVYGIQFHPESVLTPEGMTMVAHFVDKAEGYSLEQPIGGAYEQHSSNES